MLSRLKQADIPGILILLLAAAVRIWALDIKPPHFDEGINGWFADQMRNKGFYDYDPTNYHGPLHFYAIFATLTLFGRNLIALRLPAVLASFFSVWMLLKFERVLPRNACRVAALALAVSPAAVFYARYSIHESWLLLFLLLTFWGVMLLWQEGSRGALWAVGMGITGMILTKETCIIHLGCILAAAATLWGYERLYPSDPAPPLAQQRWTGRDCAEVTAVSVVLVVFFYSGTFLNWPGFCYHATDPNHQKWNGIPEIFVSYLAWVDTGVDASGKDFHVKPFGYWAELICKFELPAMLGILACGRYLLPSHRFLRSLAIYGGGCLLAYSIVRYKTPWCIIVMLWPFYLVLGGLLDELAVRCKNAMVVWVPAGIVMLVSTILMWDLNFRRYTDEKHPYVYVQTFKSIDRITEPLLNLAQQNPENYHLVGHIMLDSSFPLPWILGDFTRLGYYGKDSYPPNYDAPFLVVDSPRVQEVQSKLKDTYFIEEARLRAGMDPVTIYLRVDEFQDLYPDREPNLIQTVEGPVEIRQALPANDQTGR